MLVCYMQYGVLKQANQTHYNEYDIRIRRGKLYGYEFNGDFYTIDNFERYLKVLDKFSKVKSDIIGSS